MTVPPVDVHVYEHSDGKSIEFVSYKVLPFDVFSTAEATWKHFKGVEKHLANGSLYEKAEKGLDEPYTIIADFKKELYANSSRADIKVKQVIRRYVEEDRDIRRATQLTNECSSLMTLARSKHHHVVDVLPLRGDIGDFEGLFQRLEDSYRMLDDVFMANEAAWNHFKGVEKHLGNGSLYEKAEKGLDDPYTLIADLKKELVVEQQQKVADNLRSLLRKRATHLAKEYSAFTDAANSGHYIDRALDFRGNIDFDGNYMEFFTYKEVPFDVRETTEVSWDHWKGMEKHIMGNGGLYQKTAKDLDQPYTIIEDFTKELYSNTARADVQVSQLELELRALKLHPRTQTRAIRHQGDKQRTEAMKKDSESDSIMSVYDPVEGAEKHRGNMYEGKVAKHLEAPDTPETIIEDFAKEFFADSARADFHAKQQGSVDPNSKRTSVKYA
ncbi:hypothetical protein PC123_g2068 [Phytophthora cactorum]|nr:hypothetical protein PC123_g2068 [Phytophthora cactorum]